MKPQQIVVHSRPGEHSVYIENVKSYQGATEIDCARWLRRQGVDLKEYVGQGNGKDDWCISTFRLRDG